MIIVSGMGRCGSSLVMQMLTAGGLRTIVPNADSCAWPAYEDHRATTLLPDDDSWLEEYTSAAVKILYPADWLPKDKQYSAKGIWLDRNTKEQAKSWAQFMRYIRDMDPNREQTHKVTQQFKKQRKGHLQALKNACTDVLELTFEDILAHPNGVAQQIAHFVKEPELDIKAMAVGVLPRSAKCSEKPMEPTLAKVGPPLVGGHANGVNNV